MTGNSAQEITFEFYRYNPNLAAAIIFAALFGLVTVIHIYRVIRTKTWYFVPFLIGGVFEVIGYVGRILSSRESPNWTMGPYIIQTLFLLLAPALFAASIYMELGRIIFLVNGESRSLIKRKWLTKTFVTGDVLSFLMQAGGGGIMTQSLHTGQYVVIGGLAVQLLFFGFFMATAVTFHTRIHQRPTNTSISVPWSRHQYALYLASILILVRSVFRVIEYVEGNDGFLLRHEYFLYIFDAALMWSTMALFLVVPPGQLTQMLAEGKREDISRSSDLGYEMVITRESQPDKYV
ncbi:RTA1 like protein-domain-containing protein [Lipomyces orientalis]|uniref:RTA1 like protein-domain-containing protein n=1 Tax=Lipomyces orientalis TaxID=1233043 RepID=A0ACC3TGU4_9ASCO